MTLQIEYKKIDDLIPYIKNSRTHSPQQIQQLAASIKEFGWTNPILLDGDNGIIAGHGRLAAARLLNQIEVPTIQLNGLNENQKRAYIIADNKLALNAGWDIEFLNLEIKDLQDAGFDLNLMGFSAEELKEFAPNEDKIIEDMNIKDESRNLLMIECISEHELQNLFEEMQERGFECKILN
jgi:ParB-like chromosome segregation protein Spo0J